MRGTASNMGWSGRGTAPDGASPPNPGRTTGCDAAVTDHLSVVTALRRTLELVEASRTSPYAHDTVEDIADRLRSAVHALESGERVDRSGLGLLFAPTGSVQETSTDNGWGEECLALSEVIDAFLD